MPIRAHAGIAMWPTGEQALANCLRLVDLARRFEQRGASSFRAFVGGIRAAYLRCRDPRTRSPGRACLW